MPSRFNNIYLNYRKFKQTWKAFVFKQIFIGFARVETLFDLET